VKEVYVYRNLIRKQLAIVRVPRRTHLNLDLFPSGGLSSLTNPFWLASSSPSHVTYRTIAPSPEHRSSARDSTTSTVSIPRRHHHLLLKGFCACLSPLNTTYEVHLVMALPFVRLASRSSARLLPRFAAAPTATRRFTTTPTRQAEAEYQRTTLVENPDPLAAINQNATNPTLGVAPESRKIRHYTVNFVRSSDELGLRVGTDEM